MTRLSRAICSFVCALLLAHPAAAEPAREEASAAQSLALALIAAADAGGVFELAPDGRASVRHVGSGLICRFSHEGDGRLVLFEGMPRGDDVACDYPGDLQNVTLYATRYGGGWTARDAFDDAQRALLDRFPEARAFSPARSAAFGAGESLDAHFLTGHGGRLLYTRVSIAMVGGWTIKMRYSEFLTDEAQAERAALKADLRWAEALAALGDV